MKKFFIAVVLGLLLISTAVSGAQDYIVGEGDVLKIAVYDHADLLTIARVSGEGTILFPLIGQVKVAGLTIPQVSEKLAALLADGYVISPQITIFIEEFRSQRVTIIGQVNKPGLIELKGYTTFLEVLSKAGDLTKDAGDIATVKRKSGTPDKKESVITIDLKRLIEKGDTSQDIAIIDGDSIFVSKAGMFYVNGEVKKPDAYKYTEGTTVIKAITHAGGFSEKASMSRVKIIRKIDGKEVVLEKVKMDEPVLPDDVIVVPESFF
ncbi:MAG: SLBB domain-containing protein [Nitrospirota bacterium]